MNKTRFFTSIILPLMAVMLMTTGTAFGVAAQEEDDPQRTLKPGDPLTQYYLLETGNPYVNEIGITRETDEGILLTLNQVLIEKGRVSLAMTISGDLPANTFSVHTQDEVLIDGEYPKGGSSGIGEMFRVTGEDLAIVNISVIDQDWDIPFDQPVSFTLNIDELNIYYGNSAEEILSYSIEGPWVFEFEADGSAMAAATKIYQLDQSFPLDDGTFTLAELLVTPASQRLFATFDGENNPSVGYYALRLDDGSTVMLTCRGISTNILIAPLKTMKFFTEREQMGNFTGNVYSRLQNSKTVTFVPYIGNPAAEREMPENAPPLEEYAFTIALEK